MQEPDALFSRYKESSFLYIDTYLMVDKGMGKLIWLEPWEEFVRPLHYTLLRRISKRKEVIGSSL